MKIRIWAVVVPLIMGGVAYVVFDRFSVAAFFVSFAAFIGAVSTSTRSDRSGFWTFTVTAIGAGVVCAAGSFFTGDLATFAFMLAVGTAVGLGVLVFRWLKRVPGS